MSANFTYISSIIIIIITQQWIQLEAKNCVVSMLTWICTQIVHFTFKSSNKLIQVTT